MRDEEFMKLALRLARKGLGRTRPNPPVGSVVVKGGRIAGKGYHEKAGTPHAEVVALWEAGKRAEGATLYVTLEPCCHHGRTPPCVDAIIRAKIKRVVIGFVDPNPRVSGKGIEALRREGIEVTSGVLKEDCDRLIEFYRKYITTGIPFVTLKLAATLDGRIATKTGDSRWITSPESRRYVHRLRDIYDCVVVGTGTVRRDDPELTVRLVKGRNPARALVAEGLAGIKPSLKIFRADGSERFVFTTKEADRRKKDNLKGLGVEVVEVRKTKEGVSLKAVLKELGKRGITSVIIEGGSRLAASALREGIVDRLIFFVAPLIIGADGVPAVRGLGVEDLSDAVRLEDVRIRRFGPDIMVEATPCLQA